MAAFPPVSPRSDEPAGRGQAVAEVGFQSDPLCLHEYGGAAHLLA